MSDEATRYRKDLSALPPDHPYVVLRGRLRPGQRVLDIGCGSGELGEFLAEAGVVVDGVEANEERATVARQRLERVIHGLAGPGMDLPRETYDVVLLADVIEHIVEPAVFLRWVADHVDPAGAVYCLLPNSAHISFRRKMLFGDWQYSDQGLFDREHVRFYDIKTMGSVLQDTPFVERSREYFARRRRWIDRRLLPIVPNLFAYYVLLEWRVGTPESARESA